MTRRREAPSLTLLDFELLRQHEEAMSLRRAALRRRLRSWGAVALVILAALTAGLLVPGALR